MDIYNFLRASRAYSIYNGQLKSGNASHAYIVFSRDALTVNKFTELMAAALLCPSPLPPCMRCNSCARLIKGLHPDCISFPRKNDKLYVSDIDYITQDSAYRPAEGAVKVYRLLNGDTMNVQSQNKLLKTLEEPPLGTHILIGTTNLENLLPTIISRSVVLEIEKFEAEKIAKLLTSVYQDEKRSAFVAAACGGHLGKAIAMIEDDGYIKMQDFVYGLLGILHTSGGVMSAMEVINSYSDKTEFAELMQLYLRDCLMVLSGLPAMVINKTATDKLNAAADKLFVQDYTYLIDQTNLIKQKLQLNCNAQAAIEPFLIEIKDRILGKADKRQ